MQFGLVLLVRARGDAEVAGLGVDRVEPAVLAGLDPGDVVADRRHLPADERRRRDQHREVGLAAGAREGGGDMVLPALAARSRRGSACARRASPAARRPRRPRRGPSSRRCAARSTSCRAARCRRSPSRSSRSPASRGSGRCTWSGCTARGRPSRPAPSGAPTECMQGTKWPSAPSTLEHRAAHARHDLHADRDVGAVGQLDADVRDLASRAGPSRTARRTSCGRACSRETAAACRRRGRSAAARASRPAPSSCWSGRRLPRARSR